MNYRYQESCNLDEQRTVQLQLHLSRRQKSPCCVRRQRQSPARINFTNIFMHSFCSRRSRKCKKTDDLTVFFMLLGSARVKAVRRTAFSYKSVLCSFSLLAVWLCNYLAKNIGKKLLVKYWWNWLCRSI